MGGLLFWGAIAPDYPPAPPRDKGKNPLALLRSYPLGRRVAPPMSVLL